VLLLLSTGENKTMDVFYLKNVDNKKLNNIPLLLLLLLFLRLILAERRETRRG